MPKSRPNRKQLRNAERRAEEVNSFFAATQVRKIVEQIPNQEIFNTFLLQEKDPTKRRAMYEFCLPFVKFVNPRFPSTLDVDARIIRP